MHISSLRQTGNRFFDFVCLWVLPVGLLMLLGTLFFLPDRSVHHKLYYGLFSIPTLLALCIRPSELKRLVGEPVVIFFMLFAGFAILSLCWSPTTTAADNLIKRPLHTLMLFFGTALLLRHRPGVLKSIFLGAALLALLGTLRDLYAFALTYTPGTRLIGTGALDNPLLSSHLFGFFGIYWLWMAMDSKRLHLMALCLAAFTVMFVAVVATGSRTPLVAMTLAANWLALLCWNRRSIPLFAAAPLVIAGILLFAPHLITGRGDSYRFEIWQTTWQLFVQHPLIGHGYDAPMRVDTGMGYLLSEPHNFALGVLFNVGILGFIPWIAMIGYALYSGWKQRALPVFQLASTLLVFGIGAGLTEGGGILSRPKEHWFLLWIPLALIAGLNIARRAGCLLPAPRPRISDTQFDQLTDGARLIEEDGLGPKVLELRDGSFLKLFRRRDWYTSGAWHPYSARFVRNSQRLALAGIATPDVLELMVRTDGSQGVRYRPLSGQTVRQALQASTSPQERQQLVHRLGQFIARLHDQGVYFRSLHLGNILLLNSGEFGLIDLADMRLLPSALSAELRRRNLRHMQRYDQDRQWLFEEQVDALLEGYASTASASMSQALRTQLGHSPRTAH
ncbi:polymerase [Pseudomonas parafulva]|uniref:Polymerase n=1 Tax=Pseudomonas parafulva TaxID=157782 RepID=A0AAI8K814_9PSED|nr:bifunctional O-antigen ligase/aminoglycoside phosphotransferase family protein [Pseudomonas parafulva]AIZ35337.1 polymerase [Pseudomonas parafulva]AXO86812.1 polymerase [Pseudomonas parafulva]